MERTGGGGTDQRQATVTHGLLAGAALSAPDPAAPPHRRPEAPLDNRPDAGRPSTPPQDLPRGAERSPARSMPRRTLRRFGLGHVARALLWRWRNVLPFYRHGVLPPLKKHQLAFCDPRDITLATRIFPPRIGGCIVGGGDVDRGGYGALKANTVGRGDWDLLTTPLETIAIFDRATRHFRDGESWEDVGEIDWMMANIDAHGVQDHCRTRADVLRRCQRIDQIMADTQRTGRLLTQQELNPDAANERGGIGVIVGRNGELIWFDNGCHRLAIARCLGLPEIPICLVHVHELALKTRTVFRHLSLQSRTTTARAG